MSKTIDSDKLNETPNAETVAAMNEYDEMKSNPETYRRYSSFKAAMNDVSNDYNGNT